MTKDVHAKLEVLCETVRHISANVQEIKEKVTIQNGNVARLTEWRIQHTEQSSSLDRKIERVEDKVAKLEPVLVALRYPRVLLLAVVAIVLLSVKSSLTSTLAFLGI
jgi:predicted nuclease with TOPRIM domain